MAKDRDPRYKSGEHHYGPDDEDSTKDQLEQLSTIGAVGAEIRSVRREMKLQFAHFGARFDDALNNIREVAAGHQSVSTEHAAHFVRIKGLENRVKDLEDDDKAPSKSGEGSGGYMKILARNTAIPWVIAALLGLAMILAAITGRHADDLVPHRAGSPDAPTPPAAVNVNVKQ